MEERPADSAFLLADGTILHMEFQSANDRDMAYRTPQNGIEDYGNLNRHFLQERIRHGRQRHAEAGMLRPQLKAKFGSLPKWVAERLEAATSAQLGRWSTKLLAAGTLEEVAGKQQPLVK